VFISTNTDMLAASRPSRAPAGANDEPSGVQA
jgi:hypothetical protein